VGRGLPTSPLSCTQLSTDVGRIGCHYRPWPAHIDQMTSDVACPHRSYPAGGISEGLHASDVACAHLANDVGNRHGASAKACTHKLWRVRIDWASTAVARTDQPTTGDIGQGLHEIPWCVHTWQTTSANGTQHQPRPRCISRGLRASAGRHHPWPACIGQRHDTSVKACTHQMWHVRIWQTTSAIGVEHQPRPARISRGLCASIGRQRPWSARIGQQ